MRRAWVMMVLLGCAACSMKSDEEALLDREVPGKVLFESYTVEMTWGYKLSGMYIDDNGTVWAYEYTGTPWYPEKLKPGELSERDMLTKHKDARQIGTVDRQLLGDMTRVIKPAARGTIVHASGPGAVSGSLEVAYLFDPDASTYHEIILAGEGDRIATNSAPEAQLLLDYLRQVKEALKAPDASVQ
jgi:hypothetical protein